MRIRLIQAGKLDGNGRLVRFKKLFMPAPTMPTVAALTPSGIDVGITEDCVEDIDFDEDVDLVGITALTFEAPRAYQIADEFRKRGKKTIMGGIHASMCTEEALQHFDSVLVGEAEDVWGQVIEDVRSNNLQEIYKAPQRPDLSRLVIPKYDLLDFDNYVLPPFARTPCISIQTSRGCPYRCDFCSVVTFLGHVIRKKQIAHVLKEIEVIRPTRILFSDDNIGADPEHAKKLFAAIKPLKIRWACQMSTTIAKHPELIELAAEAGCHETLIGIESINQNVLNSVNKGFNKVSEYKTLLKRFKDVGILVQAAFIFGFDGDTADGLRRVVDTVLDWDVNYMYIVFLTPLPGTKTYKRLEDEGRILTKNWSLYDSGHPVFEFEKLNPKDLEEIIWDSYQKFYSAANIFKRLWRFKKQYIRFFPRDFALEEVFFQLMIRKSVNKKLQPFSLGLENNGKKTKGKDC